MEEGKKPVLYEQLQQLPEGAVGEIVDGQLIASPRPAGPHTLAASALGFELGGPFQKGSGGPGGWWILYEPELHLGPDVLVPDLAGWRRARMPQVPQGVQFTIAPDWVCEVLSPATARLDLSRKLPRYATAGVAHAWIVDPAQRTLEVFRREAAGRWLLLIAFGEDDRVRAEPFSEVEFELGALWGG